MEEWEARIAIGFEAETMRDNTHAAEEMLERLYDEHARALFRYASAILGSADDAEDCVQEVFIRIARMHTRLDRVDNIRAYLYTATRNAAYSMLRSKRRRNESPDEMDLDRNAVSGGGVDSSLRSMALQEGLAGLPVEQREVIVLKVYDGMTFEEIARTTGARLSTVASRYRYGIEKLRRVMEEDSDG